MSTESETAQHQREPAQFYRLSIQGRSRMSNARYLSGNCDECAISLFFNEMKSPCDGKLLSEELKLPNTAEGDVVRPLSPSGKHGTFALILSTNAGSIANAIGNFAESQVVADSITILDNQDQAVDKLQSDAPLAATKLEANALVEQLGSTAGTRFAGADEAADTGPLSAQLGRQ